MEKEMMSQLYVEDSSAHNLNMRVTWTVLQLLTLLKLHHNFTLIRMQNLGSFLD